MPKAKATTKKKPRKKAAKPKAARKAKRAPARRKTKAEPHVLKLDNLLGIEQLSPADITAILDQAETFL